MSVIDSTIALRSEAFRANRAHMLELVQRVRECEQRSSTQSALARPRFEKRNQLLPRERLALLLDPGTPFLELATLAGLGLDNPDLNQSVPGGGVALGVITNNGPIDVAGANKATHFDPRHTRAVLAQVLAVCREGDARQPQRMQFSVARL